MLLDHVLNVRVININTGLDLLDWLLLNLFDAIFKVLDLLVHDILLLNDLL